MKLKGIELDGTYKVTYFSTSFGIYNERGNRIYYENSKGYWEKWEYNELGNMIYFENSKGYWTKWVYDEKGNRIYYENSNGYWSKRKYDEKDNEIYYENSNGEIIGERVKGGERVKELTIKEIEELLGYKIKIKGE